MARYGIQYCHWRARQDVLTIMPLHEKIVKVLNPLGREHKSIGSLRKEFAELQELAWASQQVHISEARVATALDQLAHKKALVDDRLLQDASTMKSDQTSPSLSTSSQSLDNVKRRLPRKSLNVSDSIDCFEEPWVVFRGKDGKPGYVQNTCAHRACPLQFGSVNECWIQCPYHGE